jgi:hypothetical protein
MRYWIGVACRDHVEIGVRDGFCMFAHGKHSAARRLSPGDHFTYYAPTTGLGSGDPVRAFIAIGEVLEGEPEQREMAPETTGWLRRSRYVGAEPADIYPLLPELSFVTNPSHWGMYFRKSLFEVKHGDFERIAQAMNAQF